jgi:hypothetical protein
VNAIPTAPLNPPYVKAQTYGHLRPYPSTCNLGIKTEIEKNLAKIMQIYKISNLNISSSPINFTSKSLPKALVPTITPPSMKIMV